MALYTVANHEEKEESRKINRHKLGFPKFGINKKSMKKTPQYSIEELYAPITEKRKEQTFEIRQRQTQQADKLIHGQAIE